MKMFNIDQYLLAICYVLTEIDVLLRKKVTGILKDVLNSTYALNQPWHDKTNKEAVRPAKTRISLISVLAVRSIGS